MLTNATIENGAEIICVDISNLNNGINGLLDREGLK